MYCKMYVIAKGAILKKINVCKSLVELYSAILVRFSIFSLQLELMYSKLTVRKVNLKGQRVDHSTYNLCT